MYEHFIAGMKPDRGDTILDFGVSEEITSKSKRSNESTLSLSRLPVLALAMAVF
jgi:hypothetical protein